MTNLIRRIALGFYRADMYLAAHREDWNAYMDASDKASQLKFKIQWG